MNEYRNIRYIKLYFTVELVENAVLPVQKASMFRGGMGEMLLRTCCISDRKCDACGFETECLVRRIMYSKMEIQPEFMSAGDSVGYVVECDNYMTEFEAGDRIEFRLILIGKTIVYFSQILDAFYKLGICGIGKDKVRYRIVSVLNSKKEPIMEANNIHMDRVKVEKLGTYIDYRKKKLQAYSEGMQVPETGEMQAAGENRHKKDYDVRFSSPLAIKKDGSQLEKYDIQAMIRAAERRMYILCCFEGIGIDRNLYQGEMPDMKILSCRRVDVPRFSFRKSEKMVLWGLEGEIKLENVDQELIDLLLAGELLHIGRNTSFGFGKYYISL